MRVLIVEDNKSLRSSIESSVIQAGWQCEIAQNLSEGLSLAASHPFDVIVLDRMLPDGEGLDLIPRLRAIDVRTPVLILSALSETSERINGLSVGADDYLGKPFSMDELVARLVALQRRTQDAPHPEVLVVDELQVWRKWKAATRAGKPLDLTDAEYQLLLLLAERPGEVVTRMSILREVLGWKSAHDPGTAIVEVAVSRLRRKLDVPFQFPMLHTLRGRGYVLSATRPINAAT